MLLLFELLLSVFILFFIYKIITSTNVVESVLFLILLAINLSLFLFYFCSNFLGILYLAIYIGAVTVFFLFVVMMTDLNSIEVDSFQKQKCNFFLVFLFSFLLSNLAFNLLFFNQLSIFTLPIKNAFFIGNIDFFQNNIEEIGLLLLNEHSGPFILVSAIVLIALIGAIFLTSIAKQSTETHDFTNVIDSNFSNSPLVISNRSLFHNNKQQNMENQVVRSFLNSVNLSLTKK